MQGKTPKGGVKGILEDGQSWPLKPEGLGRALISRSVFLHWPLKWRKGSHHSDAGQ